MTTSTEHTTRGRPGPGGALRHLVLLVALALGTALGLGAGPARAADPTPIEVENAKPGTTAWRLGQGGRKVADDVSKQVKGYADATSVDAGGAVDLKVTVDRRQDVTAEVFRMGWYGGKGGRLMSRITGLAAQPQPACPADPRTGRIECRWATLHRLEIPQDWTSGIYLVLLTNADGFQNYIQLVVRDDDSRSAVLYQSSVMTMQAYNNYPHDSDPSCQGVPATGKNLYDSQSSPAVTLTGTPRAVEVSFDRPYSCTGADGLVDTDWSHELPFVQWMERRGYDVSYSTDVDTHQHPERLLTHRAFLSVGHDEYWTAEMFDGAERARDAGVSLGFFGSNDVYWQVRMEPSGSGQADRTQVVYKNTPNNTYSTLDPVADPSRRTVRFQDPPVNRPSQTLLGVSFLGSTNRSTLNTDLTASGPGWPWTEAGVPAGTVIPGIVGYEADAYSCAYAPPVSTGMAIIGTAPFADVSGLRDTAHAVAYTAPSGALVFAAGSMSWSWGLVHRPDPRDRSRDLYSPALDAATAVILDALTGRRPKPQLPSFTPDCDDNLLFGFERGGLTGPDGVGRTIGPVVLDTATPIAGSASAGIRGAAAYLDQPVRANEAVTVDFSVRVNTQPTSPARLAVLSSGPSDLGNLMLIPSGSGFVLRLRNVSTPVGNPSAVLQVGRTYRVRLLQMRGSGSDGVLAAYVSAAGEDPSTTVGTSVTTSLTAKTDRVRLGSTTNSATTPPVLDADIDDVHVRGTTRAQAAETVGSPSVPTGLQAQLATPTSARLTWADTSANEIGFRVERSIDGREWTLVTLTAPNVTTATDASLPPRTTVSYRVRAQGELAASEPTPVVSVTTGAAPPAVPTGLTLDVATGTLTWRQDDPGATSVEVQRASSPTFADARVAATLPGDATSWTDPRRPDGVVWYRVRALNGTSPSAWSTPVTGSRVKDMTFDRGSATGEDAADLVSGPVTVVSPGLVGSGAVAFPAGTSSYLEERFGPSQEHWVTARLRIGALGGSDVRLVQSLTAAGGGAVTTGSLWVRRDGALLLRNYNTTLAVGPRLQPGTTYQVTLHQVRVSDTQLRIEAWVGPEGADPGTPVGSVLAPVGTTAGTAALRIGSMAATGPFAATVDSVRLDTAVRPSP